MPGISWFRLQNQPKTHQKPFADVAQAKPPSGTMRLCIFPLINKASRTHLPAQPLPSPYWVGRSRAVAKALGLQEHWLESDEALQARTGKALLADIYNGQKFGSWRACLF
jgi:uncharacterized protein YdiU (UPF0061 family)